MPDLTDDGPYCRECGDDDPAYVDTNAENDVWRCRVCGDVYQTARREKE